MGRNYADTMLAQLNYGEGEILEGDAALIILKAMLQSGVAYMGGYPGAPTSTLFDAIAGSYDDILKPLGIYFEGSGNEASAAAMLQISVDNPIRGAVNWKVVGTNVASDVIAHVASSGVKGGAVMFVGEDYGLDSTTVAEKTQVYALKSGLAVIDPPADPQKMAWLVEESFNLSEASELPVFFLLRTRPGNLKGSIVCKDNQPPQINANQPVEELEVVRPRIPQPPYSLGQERDKFEKRFPAAQKYILEHKLNEYYGNPEGRIGLITHGAIFNTTMRALQTLGLSSSDGATEFSILQLNVIEPLVPEQILDFVRDKDAVLVVEEGMPNLIEVNIRAMVQEYSVNVPIHGKDVLPKANEYTPEVLIEYLSAFAQRFASPDTVETLKERVTHLTQHLDHAATVLDETLSRRSPIFCTGCPERPIFSALKIAEDEFGKIHYAGDIGCYSMGSFAPFYMSDSITGMGTALATTGPMQKFSKEKMVSFMGDGTFWHSGLTTSFANSLYNNQDGVAIIFENGWTSMTGEQENPTSGINNMGQQINGSMNIEQTLKSMGAKFVERVNPYNFKDSLGTLRRAFQSKEPGLKVVISDGECQLQRQRRVKVEKKQDLDRGKRVTDSKFGIDDDVCTGDHSCMRYNGCPSLTLKDNPNPLRDHQIATIDTSCVGCGLCGEVTHEAVLCPSFYEATVVTHPGPWERFWFNLNQGLIKLFAGVRV